MSAHVGLSGTTVGGTDAAEALPTSAANAKPPAIASTAIPEMILRMLPPFLDGPFDGPWVESDVHSHWNHKFESSPRPTPNVPSHVWPKPPTDWHASPRLGFRMARAFPPTHLAGYYPIRTGREGAGGRPSVLAVAHELGGIAP